MQLEGEGFGDTTMGTSNSDRFRSGMVVQGAVRLGFKFGWEAIVGTNEARGRFGD